jgi:hypothetical protein
MNAPRWSRRSTRRSAGDQRHRERRGGVDERTQARIARRERERLGEIELVAGERQLGKEQQLGPLLRRHAHEPEVLGAVRVDVPALRDRARRRASAFGPCGAN